MKYLFLFETYLSSPRPIGMKSLSDFLLMPYGGFQNQGRTLKKKTTASFRSSGAKKLGSFRAVLSQKLESYFPKNGIIWVVANYQLFIMIDFCNPLLLFGYNFENYIRMGLHLILGLECYSYP